MPDPFPHHINCGECPWRDYLEGQPAPASVAAAAGAILALINGSPRTPRREELEAIIRNVAAPMQALSPEHLAYRALRAQLVGWKEPENPKDQEADEQAFAALLDRVSDMEKAIWVTPATTLADVLLRAEIAEDNENGMMDDIDNPDAYLDDRAMAQLTRAVLDVLGSRNAL